MKSRLQTDSPHANVDIFICFSNTLCLARVIETIRNRARVIIETFSYFFFFTQPMTVDRDNREAILFRRSHSQSDHHSPHEIPDVPVRDKPQSFISITFPSSYSL